MKPFGPLIALCILLLVPSSAQATMLGIKNPGLCLDNPSDFYLIEEGIGTVEQLDPPIDPVRRPCAIYGMTRRRSDGAFYAAGIEWGAEPIWDALMRISPGTWTITTVTPITLSPPPDTAVYQFINALAFSADDALYGIAVTGHWEDIPDGPRWDAYALVRLNPDTGMEEEHFELSDSISSLEFAPDGTLYGWNRSLGLFTIDPATGDMTDVKPREPGDPLRISSIAFAADGTLYGFPRYPYSGRDDGWIYTIEPRSGVARAVTYVPPEGPWVDAVANLGPRLVVVDSPPRRFFPDSLFLLDCMSCPQCFGRMCDPRAREEWDPFFIVEPRSAIAEIFSRAEAGLRREDGPLRAGAPVAMDDKTLFVVSAPFADSAHPNAGAILFLSQKGKVVHRIDGRTAGETLGLAMDVRGNEVAVASARQLLRLRDGKVVARVPLGKSLFARAELRVTFADDMDGDKLPEIRVVAPYATANGLKEAGVIQLIGSKTGSVLKTKAGKVARQHLGGTPPR